MMCLNIFAIAPIKLQSFFSIIMCSAAIMHQNAIVANKVRVKILDLKVVYLNRIFKNLVLYKLDDNILTIK